jgi:glycosyltransferase involved in cell wall biosynthesis
MRAGLPVVASNVGGVSEAVVNGQTGFLVAQRDLMSMRHALALLIENPDLRLRMGLAARQGYSNQFTFELIQAIVPTITNGCCSV